MSETVFSKPKYLKDAVFHYCPGCGHGITHRLIAEVIEELDIGDKSICVPPAGCAVLAHSPHSKKRKGINSFGQEYESTST